MKFDIVTKAGLSQQQFADLVGVSRVTVNTWFTGKHAPAPHTRSRVVVALNHIRAMVKERVLPLDADSFRREKQARLRQLRARIDNEVSDSIVEV